MNTLSVHVRAKRHSPHTCTVANLQFSARAGEFIAIVGPSGAGKTTLLKIISGLDTAFDGEIRLPAGATLGYMFQEARLMPWLTVLENLQLIPSAMQRQQLLEMLEMVGLKECASLYPRQLSGGMQRRVALLRAFIVQPQLLLMDEPFQALDAPTAAQLRAQLGLPPAEYLTAAGLARIGELLLAPLVAGSELAPQLASISAQAL